MEKQEYIEAGRICNTHGVAGEVKIEVWLDSPDFLKKCGSPRRGRGSEDRGLAGLPGLSQKMRQALFGRAGI